MRGNNEGSLLSCGNWGHHSGGSVGEFCLGCIWGWHVRLPWCCRLGTTIHLISDRHIGQLFLFCTHFKMQSKWYLCVHLSRHTQSVSLSTSEHIAHSVASSSAPAMNNESVACIGTPAIGFGMSTGGPETN